MKKFKVTVEQEIIVSFDENSDDFKELWEGYTQAIDKGADYVSFSESIASLISRYGIREFIEGVGVVEHNGAPQVDFYPEKKIHTNPVNVEVETDLNGRVDFEVAYTDEISGY